MIYNDYLPNSTGIATTAGLSTNGNYGINSNTSRADLIDRLNNTENWSDLLNGNVDLSSKATAKGTVDLETLLASVNDKYNSQGFTVKGAKMKDGIEGYYVGFGENHSSYTAEIIGFIDETYDYLYLPFKRGDTCAYFLASPSAKEDGFMWLVNSNNCYLTWNIYNCTGAGICPIVHLSSSVQTTGKNASGEWVIE